MSPPFKFFSGKPIAHWLVAGCLAGSGLSALAQPEVFGGDPTSNKLIPIPANTDDWMRHFRLGAVVGMNINAKFGLSANYNFGINGNNPGKGIYDDGYVHTDQSGDPNYTSYWGYNNASQYANNQLTFNSATSYTVPNGGQSSDDGSAFPGLDLSYGGNLWYWKHARIGWELGFGLLPIDITDRNTYGISVQQNSIVYNVPPGVILPTAPYTGGSSGIGPLIPTAYATNYTSSIPDGTLGGSRTLNVMLYTVRLGPTIYWDLTDKFAVYFGAGPAVGIADGELKYNDVISTMGNSPAYNNGSISAVDFTYGYYVNGTILYHVTDNADIYIGAQYMPLGSVDFNGNGRQSQLQLDGQLYLSAGINWPF